MTAPTFTESVGEEAALEWLMEAGYSVTGGPDIAQETGERHSEGNHSWNLGLLYEETDPARTVALMSVLVEYERKIGHPDAEADAGRVAEIQAKLTGGVQKG
jgi:hypothetical protein